MSEKVDIDVAVDTPGEVAMCEFILQLHNTSSDNRVTCTNHITNCLVRHLWMAAILIIITIITVGVLI